MSITVEGVEYQTNVELAKAYNIPYNTLAQRLNRNWSVEEAVGIIPHTHKGKSIVINGKQYHSKQEAIRDLNLTSNQINCLINGEELKQTNKIQVEIDGVVYESKAEAKRKLNLNRSQLDTLLRVEKGKTYTIIVDGQEYTFTSKRKLCLQFGLDYEEALKAIRYKQKTFQELVDEKLASIKE